MPPIIHLTNPTSHAQFTRSHEASGAPYVLYVFNFSLPACKAFTPQYEELAARYSSNSNPNTSSEEGKENQTTFAQMDFSSETSMLFKFAENQLPVLTLMCRESGENWRTGMLWAKMVTGADLRGLEEAIGEMMGRVGRGGVE
ncbi:hypothetical protein DL98DRAFT_121193 [Cadophora sp. DSE1049]|nr:hypothetical protein DL98DRAFT_121193 [Cadophora sp. DSE1049]